MITGWLLKIVIVIAVLGLVFIEVGSPVIAHFQVDGAAHDAADDAAADWFHTHNPDSARDAAQHDADDKHATLELFEVNQDTGAVKVKLYKQAKSFVLKKLSFTKKWYDVRVTATSAGPKS